MQWCLKNFHNSLYKQLRVSVFSSQQPLTLTYFLTFKTRLHHTEHSLKLITNALFNALYFRSECAERNNYATFWHFLLTFKQRLNYICISSVLFRSRLLAVQVCRLQTVFSLCMVFEVADSCLGHDKKIRCIYLFILFVYLLCTHVGMMS